MIDGSGSLGEAGWESSVKAASLMAGAFDTPDADAQLAVLLYSGPRTWDALYLCTGDPQAPKGVVPDLKEDCGIEWVTGDKNSKFEEKTADVVKAIEDLDWPAATTLTSVALETVNDALTYGRKDAASVVVVITDGRPMN